MPGAQEAAARQQSGVVESTPVDPASVTDGDPKPHEPSVSEISSAQFDSVKLPDPKVQAPSTEPGAKPPGFDVETPAKKSLFGDAVHHVIGTDLGGEITPNASEISSGLSGLVDTRLAAIELQNKELRESLASMRELLQAVLTSQDKPADEAPAKAPAAAPAAVPPGTTWLSGTAPTVAPLPA